LLWHASHVLKYFGSSKRNETRRKSQQNEAKKNIENIIANEMDGGRAKRCTGDVVKCESTSEEKLLCVLSRNSSCQSQLWRFTFDGKRNDNVIAKEFDSLLIELLGNQLANTFAFNTCH
jgi:hypothetical protein